MRALSIIFIGILSFCCTAAEAQYFVLFTDSKEHKPQPDLGVHLSHLRAGQKPDYAFFITDARGLVSVKDSGDYLIQVAVPGFKVFQDTLHVNHPLSKPLAIRLESLDFDLNEVVVSGEFEIKSVDNSLNRVRVIDRKRIEKQGAVNLKDLLSNELNIRLSVDPILGTSMSLQGLSGQNIKILIDGVPLIGRTDGNIDLSQINLANIERIEIIEGPMSVIYGTDAIGGVINLITKKSASHTFELSQSSYTESNGTYNFDGRLGWRKKGWNLQASGGRNFFQGVAIGNEVRSRTWKPREQVFADLIFGKKIGNSLHRVQSSYFDEKITSRGEPVFTPYAIYGRDQYFYTTRLNNALYSDFRLSPNTTLNFIESYSWFSRKKLTYRKDLVNLTEIMTGDSEDQDTNSFSLYLFRGILSHRFNKVFHLQTGYDINLESTAGERILNNRQHIGDYALFATAEIIPVQRINIKPGLRFIYNTRYGAPVIPSLNIKYDLSSSWALRVAYARGFRAPSLKELSFFFVDVNHNVQGNQDLQAERSHNLSLSFAHQVAKRKWSYKLELAGFYNQITNMINLAAVNLQNNLYQYANIDEFQTRGINLNGEFKRSGLSLNGGVAYVGRSNSLNKTMAYSPEYRINASYPIPHLGIDASIFYKMTGSTPGFALDANSEVVATRIESYQTMDISLAKTFWRRRLNLVAGVKNVFDVTNINFSGSAGGGTHAGGGSSLPISMGRTYFVNLRINLIRMK
ncbi:MAG: TonB-dependent receptor [Bacteroidetes bacterium]|nr:MAG: TonB-dependent receptor [Bacteroidota bacterium]